MFKVFVKYPTFEEERRIARQTTSGIEVEVNSVLSSGEVLRLQNVVRQVPVSETVGRYAVDLVRATRPEDPMAPDIVKRYVQYGASVRATMFVTLAAKARALMMGRYHVTHDDIAALALPVMRHRVLTNYFAESDKVNVDDVLRQLVEEFSPSGRTAQAG